MKKKLSAFMAVVILVCAVTVFSSCGKENDSTGSNNATVAETKNTTSEVSKIIDAPTEKDAVIDMFNKAIGYVDEFCYSYTKTVKNSVGELSIGSLSKVNNAESAFKKVFGEKESNVQYKYKDNKDGFNANFTKDKLTSDMVVSFGSKKDGDLIIITVNLPSETNPDEKTGNLSKFTNDYINVKSVQDELESFGSSSSATSIFADNIFMTAEIDANNSTLKKFTIGFNENFTLSGVKLVEVDGSTVTGKMSAEIEYTEIG